MKSIFLFLTVLLVAVAVTPRESYGQYTWVPVYSNGPAPISNAVPGPVATPVSGQEDPVDRFEHNVATFIGDIEHSHDAACSKGCDCPSCRHRDWRARTYVGIEYLQWYNKGRKLPPLVTTGNPVTTAFSDAGVLPNAGTLFGGRAVGDDLKAGARLTGGFWFNADRTRGVVIRAYGTEGDSNRFGASSLGNPILAVPFIDQSSNPLTSGQENALVLSYAGGLTPSVNQVGDVSVDSSNEIFGGDTFFRLMMDEGCDYRIDLLGGYQMTRVNDGLVLNTRTQQLSGLGQPTFETTDVFAAKNEYHAGLLGLMGEIYKGPLTIQMMGKVGIGNMRQTVAINGSYQITDNIGLVDSGAGGLFAQNSQAPTGPAFNIGNHQRDLLVWSPEASVRAIYCVTDKLSVSVGYSFLYWTRMALAGDIVDRNVNRDVTFGGTYLPGGGPNPAFAFNDTDFWVQTIDIGLLLNY